MLFVDTRAKFGDLSPPDGVRESRRVNREYRAAPFSGTVKLAEVDRNFNPITIYLLPSVVILNSFFITCLQ